MGRYAVLLCVLLCALVPAQRAGAQASSWVRPPTESDVTHALQWITFSAQQGEAWAQYMLGTMYEFGRGVHQSDTEAFAWYLKAAEGGDVGGQFRCGLLLHEGRGTDRDDPAALDWLTRAEAGGSAEAANLLGVLYALGNGVVAVDEARAVDLWKKAAKAGVPDAQLNLAVALAHGRGVEADLGQAGRWYAKAAYAYLDAGRRAEAARALAALGEIAPDHPELPNLAAALGPAPPPAPAPAAPPAAPLSAPVPAR